MTLVESDQIGRIAGFAGDWLEVAGGSAANTAFGLASLGGRPKFVGAVGRDSLGTGYELDMEAAGVQCVLSEGAPGLGTGQCLVFVTSDLQRTMATYLGAGVAIGLEAVERAGISSAGAVYLEGYLLDSPWNSAALKRAVELARRDGVLVALSLSDPFLVERHGEVLAELVAGEVDVLFLNEEEARKFTGADDLEGALSALERPGLTVAVTLGAEGAVLLERGERSTVAAWPVSNVEDTTGAGDLFAAGVLHGIVSGLSLESAGRLGALAAGEVISHLGARPVASLAALARIAGLVDT